MKKNLIALTLIGLFSIGINSTLKADNEHPCKTISDECPNGVSYTAIVCDYADYLFWDEYYCGISPE